MPLVERQTRSERRNCPTKPKPAISDPVVTIKAWHDHLGTDLQFDFRRDPKSWQRVRDAMAAVKEKIERDFENEALCPARPRRADVRGGFEDPFMECWARLGEIRRLNELPTDATGLQFAIEEAAVAAMEALHRFKREAAPTVGKR
jgi:hypothetical protein